MLYELRCPACNRYLGEISGRVRLTSCPGCSSEVVAQTTTTGMVSMEFRIPSKKRSGPYVTATIRATG